MEEILREILNQLQEIRIFLLEREIDREKEKALRVKLCYLGSQPVSRSSVSDK